MAIPERYHAIIQRVIPDVEFHQNRYAREIADALPARGRWLDVGAGARVHSGWVGASAADLVARASILIGCDIVPSQLARNATLTAGAVADVAALPFASGSFDLVTANMVLEHLSAPARVFAEIARVLVPGGRFVFVTPNRAHPAVTIMATLITPPVRRGIARFIERRDPQDIFLTHYQANTTQALARLATGAGLVARRVEPFPSFPMVRSPGFAVWLETVWIRGQRRGPLRRFASNLVGTLEKPLTSI